MQLHLQAKGPSMQLHMGLYLFTTDILSACVCVLVCGVCLGVCMCV